MWRYSRDGDYCDVEIPQRCSIEVTIWRQTLVVTSCFVSATSFVLRSTTSLVTRSTTSWTKRETSCGELGGFGSEKPLIVFSDSAERIRLSVFPSSFDS